MSIYKLKKTSKPIPVKKRGGWVTKIFRTDKNGNVIWFHLESKYGILYFGIREDNHVGWWWKETGGGGPITLPYAIINDELYVALVNEYRWNLGGRRWCAIGGFKKPDETNDIAQAREAADEAGVNTSHAVLSDGYPFVSNRNYFVADCGFDEGIHAYLLEVPAEELKKYNSDSYQFKNTFFGFNDREHIRFMHWRVAMISTPDGIALAGIAKLIAHVCKKLVL